MKRFKSMTAEGRTLAGVHADPQPPVRGRGEGTEFKLLDPGKGAPLPLRGAQRHGWGRCRNTGVKSLLPQCPVR